MLNITMARGDIEACPFDITDSNGQLLDIDFDEIYFTVKRNFSDRTFLFQKRLGAGTIEKIETGKYTFTIEPNDTDYLSFGKYVFDIELLYENEIKKTFTGILTLTEESTHYVNE